MKVNQPKPALNNTINLSNAFLFVILFCMLISWKGKCGDRSGKINDPIKAPVAINLLDANQLLSVQIPTAKITLIDDGGQVVTPNNLSFKTLEINGGVMSLGLKKKAQFDSLHPYRFAIKVEAPGYSTNYRTIVISKDKAQYIPIFMVKIDAPPAGMSGAAGTIPINRSTITEDVTIMPKKSKEQKRKVSVNLAKGTVLMSYGKKVKGTSVSYKFSYASPTSLAALRTFPGSMGGTLIADAIDINGKPIATPGNPNYFTSAGWITLEMNSGDQNITEFSDSVQVIMPIDDSSINPATSKPYKAKDKIDIWSLNEQSVWKNEGIAVVKYSDEGLIATMYIKHLSDWNLDYWGADQCLSTKINYCNQITGTASTVPLWCEIWQTQGSGSGTRFSSCGAGGRPLDFNLCHPFNPGDPCTTGCGTTTGASGVKEITNGFSNKEAAFVVYNSPSGPTNGILASSIFTFCVTPSPLPNTLVIPSGTLPSVNIKIQKGGTDINNNAVFFLHNIGCQPSSTAYNYGGNLVAGETTLYSAGNFSTTTIRIAEGSIIAGMPTSTTYDFTLNITPENPNTPNVPLIVDCAPGSQEVQYRWNSSGFGPGNAGYFLITIP